MKILFLDIDGVLNFEGCEARTPEGYVGISDALVKKLRHIVDRTDAVIVLTSSWRKQKDAPMWQYLNRKLGKQGLHIGSTLSSSFHESERYEAILDWMRKNTLEGEIESWCILDDVPHIGYMEDMDVARHFIYTSRVLGLTDGDVDKAVRILSNDFGE